MSCISLLYAKQLSERKVHAVPDQKLCVSCRKSLDKQSEQELIDSDNSNSGMECEEASAATGKFKVINSTLEKFDISPVKRHAMNSSSLRSAIKKKIKAAEHKIDTVKEEASSSLNIPNTYFDDKHKLQKEEKDKAEQFDILVTLVNEKLQVSDNTTKLQLLTLAPQSWAIPKVAEVFNVSQYKVRQSRKLFREKGLLAVKNKKKGKILSDETLQFVKDFFQNDEFTRQMPGKKDCVSISKNVYMLKTIDIM